MTLLEKGNNGNDKDSVDIINARDDLELLRIKLKKRTPKGGKWEEWRKGTAAQHNEL